MKKIISLLMLTLIIFTSCKSVDPYTGEKKVNNKSKGAATGAVIGGVIGGLVKGKDGAIAGAAAGGLGGLAYGAYLDKQEEELKKELDGTGVQVKRDENANTLDLILPGNITFDTGKSIVKDNFKQTLDSIVDVVKKYDKTTLQITGFTDSTGGYDMNMALSRDRANAVKNYLVFKGVPANRIVTEGKGPANPIGDNNTASGREQNRRVEISFLEIPGEKY